MQVLRRVDRHALLAVELALDAMRPCRSAQLRAVQLHRTQVHRPLLLAPLGHLGVESQGERRRARRIAVLQQALADEWMELVDTLETARRTVVFLRQDPASGTLDAGRVEGAIASLAHDVLPAPRVAEQLLGLPADTPQVLRPRRLLLAAWSRRRCRGRGEGSRRRRRRRRRPRGVVALEAVVHRGDGAAGAHGPALGRRLVSLRLASGDAVRRRLSERVLPLRQHDRGGLRRRSWAALGIRRVRIAEVVVVAVLDEDVVGALGHAAVCVVRRWRRGRLGRSRGQCRGCSLGLAHRRRLRRALLVVQGHRRRSMGARPPPSEQRSRLRDQLPAVVVHVLQGLPGGLPHGKADPFDQEVL
mmetsp:Transcript_115502/g.331513  ORF Transcript_115502/g.331513 Transcript_115502/m.331513 type:complete len:359 (+) Transcript_115502:705-1781(+)